MKPIHLHTNWVSILVIKYVLAPHALANSTMANSPTGQQPH